MLTSMERLSPEGLVKPAAYSQVVVAQGKRIIFVAGQVSQDREGKLVADGDLAGQARQVYANLGTALAAAGASAAEVVKLTTFVVNYRPEVRAQIAEARAAFLHGAPPPASTLVGVQALAEPGYLIEIEAIAVTD